MTDYMLYEYHLDNLSFTVKIYQDAFGKFQAEVSVTEGHMDLNALWFSDGDALKEGDTSLSKSDKSLNMNGASSEDGPVVWDDYCKLSNPGLGSEGTNKATYVTAGETTTFQIDGVPDGATLDYFQILGIRATTTATNEGSIKLVDRGQIVHVDQKDNFEEWGTGPDNPEISHITLYWRASDIGITPSPDRDGDTAPHGVNDPDGWFTVKFDYSDGAMIGNSLLSQDLDDNIDAFLNFLVAQGYITNADKDDLVGVNISGGNNNDSNDQPGDGKWYDYHLSNTDPGSDPVPQELIDSLNNIDNPYPIANQEIDVAYAWNNDISQWVATL